MGDYDMLDHLAITVSVILIGVILFLILIVTVFTPSGYTYTDMDNSSGRADMCYHEDRLYCRANDRTFEVKSYTEVYK